MASKYSIEAVFKLIDNITAPLDKVAGKGSAVGRALKNDFIQADKAVQEFGKKAAKAAGDAAKSALKVGAAFAAAGAAAATAFAVKGLKDAIEFERGMAQIGARANLTTAQIRAMSGDLLKLSNVTGTGISSLQEAQLKITEAGISAADSVSFLETAVKAAGGGFADTTTVISGLTSVLKSYGLQSSAASHISDQMMAAARAGGVSFEDMSTKLEHVLPVAAKFGVSSEKLFASIASLTSQGVPIADAAKKIKSALEKNGAAGLFNVTNAEVFNSVLGQITNSAGVTQMAFERIDQTTGSKWGSLLNKVKNTGIGLGESLLPVFNKVIDKLSVFADRFAAMDFEPLVKKIGAVVDRIFNSLDFDKLANGISGLFSTISTLIDIIIKVGGVIWDMRGIIIGAAIAWGIYKAAMMSAAIIGPIMGLVKAVQVLMAVQKGMNVVQAIFNVLMYANPIGLIITGIGILIGLIITLVLNWEKVIAVLSSAWDWIKKVAGIIKDGLCNAFWNLMDIINQNQNKVLSLIAIFTGPFGFILAMVNELRNNWESVVETFQSEGIIAGIKHLGGVLLSGVLAPIQGLLEMLSKIPGVGAKLGPAVAKIEEFRNTLKGTQETIEKPLLTRPAQKIVENTIVNKVVTENITSPASAVNNVTPPQINQTASMNYTSMATATPGGVRQPALLDLRSPVSARAVHPVPASVSSPWLASTTATGGISSVTPQPALSPATTSAINSPAVAVSRASPQPVTIPVNYDFSEMVIPPEIIKTITLPVIFAYLAPKINRTAPPGPVNNSVREGITPPAPPMTQAEQIIYSKTDNFENIRVELCPRDGTSARITKAPKSPNIELVVSGDE